MAEAQNQSGQRRTQDRENRRKLLRQRPRQLEKVSVKMAVRCVGKKRIGKQIIALIIPLTSLLKSDKWCQYIYN